MTTSGQFDPPATFPDVPATALRRHLQHQSLDGSGCLARKRRRAARHRPCGNGRASSARSGASGASVELVEPQDGLPDLVFTANSAVVLDGRALRRALSAIRSGRSRNRSLPRRSMPCARAGLIDDVVTLPPGVTLEGAGDCLWDVHRRLFWMGCGLPLGGGGARDCQRAIRRAVRCFGAGRSERSTTSTPASARCRAVP